MSTHRRAAFARVDSDAATVPYDPQSPLKHGRPPSPEGWTAEDDNASTAPSTPVKMPAPRRNRRLQAEMEGLVDVPQDVLGWAIAKQLSAAQIHDFAHVHRHVAPAMRPVMEEAERCLNWLQRHQTAEHIRKNGIQQVRAWYDYRAREWKAKKTRKSSSTFQALLQSMKDWPIERISTLRRTPGLLPTSKRIPGIPPEDGVHSLAYVPQWFVLLTLGAYPGAVIPWLDADFLLAWKAVVDSRPATRHWVAYLQLAQVDPSWASATMASKLPHQVQPELFQDMSAASGKWFKLEDMLGQSMFASPHPIPTIAALSNEFFVRRITDHRWNRSTTRRELNLFVFKVLFDVLHHGDRRIPIESLTQEWYDDTAITRPSSPATMEDVAEAAFREAMGSPPSGRPTIPVGFVSYNHMQPQWPPPDDTSQAMEEGNAGAHSNDDDDDDDDDVGIDMSSLSLQRETVLLQLVCIAPDNRAVRVPGVFFETQEQAVREIKRRLEQEEPAGAQRRRWTAVPTRAH